MRPTTIIRYGLAHLLTFLICEPQLRLGRRRHDGRCDRCEEPIGAYAMERLNFPWDEPDDLYPASRREKLAAMLEAEYQSYCLECHEEVSS